MHYGASVPKSAFSFVERDWDEALKKLALIEGNGEETHDELLSLSDVIFPGVDTVAIYITYSFGLVDPAVQRVMPPLSFDQRLVLEFCVEKERPNPVCVIRQTFFINRGI